MKKGFCLFLTASVMLLLCSCSGRSDRIEPVTREDGSGTRTAFSEIFGIVESDGTDAITPRAEVTNSTAVMISSVSGYKNAIGYISFGSMSKSIKAVAVDGVAATEQNIIDGKYSVVRNFNLITAPGLSETAEDFISFVFSAEGQGIVNECGYIGEPAGNSYTASGMKGTVRIAGSTSVAPVLEKIAEKYSEINREVTVEIQQTGSSAGIQSVINGVCDIGMSSRELSSDEKGNSLTSRVMARDGIAIIVNTQNDISSLTAEQIKNIFLGNTKSWSELETTK